MKHSPEPGTSNGNDAAQRRLKILIIADSCNPDWESVALEGWSHWRALSELVDTHVVTRAWNREALNKRGLVEGQDYTTINTDALFNPAQDFVRWVSGPNKGWAMLTALTIPSYIAFEWLLWRRFRRALKASEYDLVHRITPLSPPMPSPIAARCRRAGVPFVLGPLNGGLPWPPQFPDLMKQEGEFLSKFRGLYRALPGYRATRQNAAAIIVGSASAKRDLAARWHGKAVYVPENGIDLSRFPRPVERSAESYLGRPLRAVFLGRLVPFKAADILLEAAAPLLRDNRLTLEIIGSGPEEPKLRAIIAELGLEKAVSWAGKIPHQEVAARLSGADLLTFPSIREFGGAVVLEAMAMGVVPVVVDYGGPGELLLPTSGYLLPMTERAGLIANLRTTLEQITVDPAQLATRSRLAVERAFTLFTWPAKARQTLEVYRWVLGLRKDKPDQPLPLPDIVA